MSFWGLVWNWRMQYYSGFLVLTLWVISDGAICKVWCNITLSKFNLSIIYPHTIDNSFVEHQHVEMKSCLKITEIQAPSDNISCPQSKQLPVVDTPRMISPTSLEIWCTNTWIPGSIAPSKTNWRKWMAVKKELLKSSPSRRCLDFRLHVAGAVHLA